MCENFRFVFLMFVQCFCCCSALLCVTVVVVVVLVVVVVRACVFV